MQTAAWHARPARGVTLIELMISMALLAVVMATVITAFLAENRLYQNMGATRGAQTSARNALDTIARYVGRAGFGVGPEFAFDFSWYDCSKTCAFPDSCGAGCAPANRDSATGPDELVFMERDPAYYAEPDFAVTGGTPKTRGNAWHVTGATATSLTLDLHGGDRIAAGQVIEVLCRGAFTYTYVTALNDVPGAGVVGGTPDTVTSTSVPLATGGTDPFDQPQVLSKACFSSGLSRAFAIDRYRFFVRTVPTDPTPRRPFLYLDRGTDTNDDGAIDGKDLLAVAPDIEDLQVAYIMRSGTTYGGGPGVSQPDLTAYGDPLFSAATGGPCSTEIKTAYYKPFALAPCILSDGRRKLNLPGNITAVRISLVARTLHQNRTNNGTAIVISSQVPPSVEDHPSTGVPDGYIRRVLTTTVQLPNLDARGIPLI